MISERLRARVTSEVFWPGSVDELIDVQGELAAAEPDPWELGHAPAIGGCAIRFPRGESGPGSAGDPAWAAAVAPGAESVVTGSAGAPYAPGLLALREGRLLEAAVRGLAVAPDVLLVDATGRDHPRRAGLALHLGAVLDLPTVGVTHRPLLAERPVAGRRPRRVVAAAARGRDRRRVAAHAARHPSARRPRRLADDRRCRRRGRPRRARPPPHARAAPPGTAPRACRAGRISRSVTRANVNGWVGSGDAGGAVSFDESCPGVG